MSVRIATAATAVALSGLALGGLAAPSFAQTPVCDPYSQQCVTPPPTVTVIPTVNDRPTTSSTPGTDSTTEAATLPFTGGELVLMTAVGAGALASGTALVLAGRRRKPGTSA